MNLKGKTVEVYGLPDHSISVVDVVASVTSLPHEPRGQFHFTPSVVAGRLGHLQSIARISRPLGQPVSAEHWLVITKHHRKKAQHAGLFFVRFPHIASAGLPWGSVPETQRQGVCSPLRGRQANLHPGGSQICGNYLAVAQSDPGARIDIFQVGNPTQEPTVASTLHLDSHPKPQALSNVSCVALTRLADDRYLLYAHRYSEGADIAEGRFYISKGTTLNAAQWDFLGLYRAPDRERWSYENVNFLVEARTGDIYLAGMQGRGRFGRLDLYLLGEIGGTLGFQPVASRELRSSVLGARLRAGAGLHVTPHGRLVLYATSMVTPGGIVRLDEFSAT